MSLTVVGLLTIALSQVFEAATAADLAADIMLVGGILLSWYGRYRIGGVTLLGTRK